MSVTVQDAPDYTGLANVTIVGQIEALEVTGSITVSSGNVEITGPLTASGNIAVAIQESIQLDVNITNSVVNITGDVTVSSGSVDISGPLSASGNVNVAIQESVQIDVNVTNSTLNISGDVTVSSGSVDISGPLTTDGYVAVEITKSITIDVNVTNSTLSITGDVTVSSGSVDISGPLTTEGNVAVAIQQSIQLDVNVTNSVINIQGSVDANITNATLTIEGDVNVTNSVLNVSITNEVLQSKLAKPALAFNGENAYVGAPNFVTQKPFSLYMRVKLTGFNTTQIFDSRDKGYGAGGKGLAIHDLNGNGKLRVGLGDGTNYVWTGTVIDLSDMEQHDILITCSSSTMNIYVDGTLVATQDVSSIADSPLNAATTLTLAYGLAGYYPCIIYEFLYWNKELDANERSQVLNNPQSPPTTSLVCWLNFDEGSGSTAYDKSGNGNHGTIYNAVWVSEQGQVAPLLAVNIAAKQVTLDINITAREVDLWVITRTGKAVSFQTIVGKNDYYTWKVSAGSSATETIAWGKGRFKRLVGQIFTTSSSAYVNWRNIRIAIRADGEDKFSAGGLSIFSIDEVTGALTIHSVEGKSAGGTWPPYRPGRAFRIVYIKHDNITDTYEPTDEYGDPFDLPFRMLAFEIEMDIEFEEKLEIEVTNLGTISPTSDIVMFGWVEWGEYL